MTSRIILRTLKSNLLRLRPLTSVAVTLRQTAVTNSNVRLYSTRQTTSSLNDPNPNWSNRPPKETILLDGCDFEHWLVVVDKPEGEATRDEIIDTYINTLAKVVGRILRSYEFNREFDSLGLDYHCVFLICGNLGEMGWG
nr:multiple organellar RNA editing factor 8, chloroplastic/mitochondrial-like [Tanacetum cinerariifolium]